ncbi:predicted protein [Histoplasma capsulatum H143]|uniref:Uncharacterized protein n=1 Tax=Ajellomyces capsulatus (strain H143) TaxID=544712 RepID=C6HBD4_AJECH|nr:predicted protein [Histoplasma capsulatum H143]
MIATAACGNRRGKPIVQLGGAQLNSGTLGFRASKKNLTMNSGAYQYFVSNGKISCHSRRIWVVIDSRQEQGNDHATTCVMNTPEMSVDSGSRGMDSNNIVVIWVNIRTYPVPTSSSTGSKTQEANTPQLGHDSSTGLDGEFCRPVMNISVSHCHIGTTTLHPEARLGIIPPMFVQTPRAENPSRLEADCYITILSQTIQLEQSLVISPSPPPTDLMLKAESNFRALNHSISTWKGHGQDVRDCRTIAGISFPLANNSAEIKIQKVLILLDPQRRKGGRVSKLTSKYGVWTPYSLNSLKF